MNGADPTRRAHTTPSPGAGTGPSSEVTTTASDGISRRGVLSGLGTLGLAALIGNAVAVPAGPAAATAGPRAAPAPSPGTTGSRHVSWSCHRGSSSVR